MHDPGISDDRELEFVEFFLHQSKGFFLSSIFKRRRAKRFHQSYQDYVKQRVQETPTPCFAERNNSGNVATRPTEPLMSVFIINGLSEMFIWAKEPHVARLSSSGEFQKALNRFRDYLNDASSLSSLDFVHQLMDSTTSRAEFLQIIGALYEVYRLRRDYHPIWLTKWSDFEPCANLTNDDKGDRWCHLVGVCNEKKKGQWVAVLKFDPEHLGTLYTPTVLDTKSSYYFPLPENGTRQNGIAADLRMEDRDPAAEYICQWPSLDSALTDPQLRCSRLMGTLHNGVQEVRRHHISKLRQNFSNSRLASDWLDRVTQDEVS